MHLVLLTLLLLLRYQPSTCRGVSYSWWYYWEQGRASPKVQTTVCSMIDLAYYQFKLYESGYLFDCFVLPDELWVFEKLSNFHY